MHSESNAEFYAYLIITDTRRRIMNYYARQNWQVDYVGKTTVCHSEKLPCGFILLRASVWCMTNMIEQIGLTLHILVTNLVTLGMYQDVSFVTILIVLLIVTLFTGCAFKILKWETWRVAFLRVSHQLTRTLLDPSYAHNNTITPDLLSVSVLVTLSERKGNCISMWSEIKI